MSCTLLNPMINSQSVFQVSFAGSTWGGALACSSDVKGDRVPPIPLTAPSQSGLLTPGLPIEHCGARGAQCSEHSST